MKYFTNQSIFNMKKFASMLALFAMPTIMMAEAPTVAFEANKNQWPEQVKYKAGIPGGDLFIEKHTLTYNYIESINWHKDHRNESGGPVTQKYHAIKVNFVKANPDVEIFGNNKYSWHRNYYLGNDRSKWADNVPVYSEVYYQELYKGIDIKFYQVDNNLKYDVIVRPGANPRDVKMNYEGADKLFIENGHLNIHTTIYNLIETKPYAYQVINGQRREIPSSYVLKGNQLSFEVGRYDESLPLIIDPALIASTYMGSTADNWGFTATYDNASNIYAGGIAAKAGYPYTAGAWDATFNGGLAASPGQWPFDISLSKFNPTGTTLMYATYYGGSSNEQPHSIIVNGNNELFMVGRTNSTNFPVTGGVYDATYNGGYDVIVGKFNSVGNLLASTYVGGTADDCVNYNIAWTGAGSYGATKFSYTDDGRSEIILDASNNVYVAANTKSTNFPTTVGAYQTAFGGVQDAVVFKLNSTLTTMVFSTYLGGTGTDAAYGLKTDNSGNVYVTGGSTGNFPMAGAGVLHNTYQGGLCDGFIAVLNSTGTNLLRSTYLGTTAYDQTYMIEIDASGDLYVYGQTQGAYPVTAGVYSIPNSGMFVHKLTGSLQSTIFSTVIGNGGFQVNLSPTAFLVDSCQTIYIAGWARSSILSANMPSPSTCTGMPVTANAIQPTTDGKDHYFAVLEPNAKGLYFATFYGEGASNPDADHVDGGTSRFDKRGVIYEAFCASCGGTSGFPTSPGAYSTINQGGVPPPYSGINCNEAVVKMDVSIQPVAQASVSATNGCAPFTVTFNNQGSLADNYIWDFGDGGIDSIPNPTYVYNFAGTYTITLYAIDSIGICGFIDTSLVAITVGAAPTLSTSVTNIPCPGGVGTATVSTVGGLAPLTYLWQPSNQTGPVATGLNSGSHTVTVTDAQGCPSTQIISVQEPLALNVTTTANGTSCGMNNGSVTATTSGGTGAYTYNWQPSGGNGASASNLPSGVYTITVTDANGCTTTATANVQVVNGPTVVVQPLAPINCNGGTGSAVATLTGGTPGFTYNWSNGSTGNVASGLTSGTYTITITDSKGCSATNTVNIPEPAPLVLPITTSSLTCYGNASGSATVTPTGGVAPYTYLWGTTPVQNGNIAGGLSANTTYTLLVADANGCTATATVSPLSQPAPIAISTAASGTSCGTTYLGVLTATPQGGSAPYGYTWSNGGWTQVISNVAAGQYSVVVTDANGCTGWDTITMPASPMPIANFIPKPIFSCEGVTFLFTDDSSPGVSAWNWNFGDGSTSTSQNPSHQYPYFNGSYNVTLYASQPPCQDDTTIVINVSDIFSYVSWAAANVFTPNGDGENDCFLPSVQGQGADTLKMCIELQVFDRWGVEMFNSDGQASNCWDGNAKNGKAAMDGTYYYLARLGGTEMKGYVTLLRNKE